MMQKSMTTRRAFLCALQALPFVATAFSQPPQRSVEVVVTGARMFDNEAFVDQLVRDIAEALDDYDVTLINPSNRPKQ